ncbi:MAG: phosphate signaling complex protein PhoU [Desulfobacterales bacterium]|nr:phosphate signaling complex protein PhoU [Desulfobacterales bacterium]
MPKHFHRELEKLKKNILTLGAMVEERVKMASITIETRDTELANKIIRTDYEIDDMEVEVEEECLKILALYQPVAVDLRFLITVIKINNDLERIADLAVNIAERMLIIAKYDKHIFTFDYSQMIKKTQYMLKKSLDSLVNLDTDSAIAVCNMDDEVDAIKDEAYDKIKDAIKEKPSYVGYLINLLLISRHLERIADHTTNIAEEVVYLVDGEIVRHGKADIEKNEMKKKG